MSNYVAPSCQNVNDVTKPDELLADFECIGSGGKDDGSKPCPTTTAASEAPAEPSTAEPENTGDIPAIVGAATSSFKVVVQNGALTLVSSSSSSGAPVELSGDLMSALQALTLKAEAAAKADGPAARATSPAPMSEERRAAVRKAKQAEIRTASVKQQKLEAMSEKLVGEVKKQQEEFETMVAAQKELEEREIQLFETVLVALRERAVNRVLRDNLYNELMFNAAHLTDEIAAEKSTELVGAMMAITKYSEQVRKVQSSGAVDKIEKHFEDHVLAFAKFSCRASRTRDQRSVVKTELRDQDAILQNLEEEYEKI